MGVALGDYEARVQVAFDAGPFNASPTWTDITEDVLAEEGLSFSRGARSVGGKPGPGLADLQMANWAADDRTNLVTNPSFETNATGWSTSDGAPTLARYASDGHSGTCSLKVTPTSTTWSAVVSSFFAVTAGQSYAASARVKASAARTAGVWLLWYNSSSAYLSNSGDNFQVLTPSTWQLVTSNVAVAPVGAAYAAVYLAVINAVAAEDFYVDAVLAEQSTTAGIYFDGTTSGYYWTGTPHASTSRSLPAGRWTPGVAASPWHPLKLKRRIRIQARYAGGSWVDLWGGHITDFVPSWIGAGKAVCDLSASDLLSALSLLKAFPNAILAEQLYGDPVLCYPLDDSEGSITAGDRTVSNRPSLTVEQWGTGGEIDFGAGSVGPESATCVAFTRVNTANGKYLSTTALPSIPLTNGLTAAVFGNLTTADYASLLTLSDGHPSTASDGHVDVELYIASSALYGEVNRNNAGTAVGSGGSIVAGQWFCGHITVTTGGAVEVFLNGVSIGTGTGFWLPAALRTMYVGMGPTLWAPIDGQVAGVAVYDEVLSAARIADHALALSGWAGELTGGRFQRLARLAGVPSGLISVTSSAGGTTMGAQPVGGKTLTTALNEVATTDQGATDIDRSGLLRFAGRDLRRGAASVVTLDARTDILNDFEGLPYNDEGLLNDVTVSRIGGATQRAVNAASALELGTISDSIEVYVEDDDRALSLAEWLANINAEPQLRAPVIKVSMAALAARSPSKVAAVMALERGQRITVSNLPAGLPATTLDLFVEGVSDAWGKNDWVRTITTSNLLRGGAVWILGDPYYSVLGSTTILGY